MADFDFSFRDRKWTKEEKDKVIELREKGKTPKTIEKLTGVPADLVKFWTHQAPKKRKSRKRRKTPKDPYPRAKFNDWLSWKARMLSASFKARFKERLDEGTCGEISVAEIEDWIVGVKKSCHYCGTKLTESNFGVDHAQPLWRGGDNAIANLRACCQNCNMIKGALTEKEYMELRKVCSKWEDEGKGLYARLKRGNKFF